MYKHGYIKVAAVTPKISVGDIEFNKIEIKVGCTIFSYLDGYIFSI